MSRIITLRQALGEAMSEEMRRDQDVFLMGEEVAEYNGAYKVSKGMLDEFGPERVIDTPIAELGDSKGLLKSAIRDNDPVCFMESEMLYGLKGEVPEEEYLTPIGVAAVRKEGTDVTIVSFNKMMEVSKAAAAELEKEGISAEVIDLRTIRPLDHKTIVESVKKTNRLVVVDESWPFAGVSAEIAYEIQKYAFDYLDAPVTRVNAADTSLPYGAPFVEEYMPNPTKVIKAVKEVMYR